MPLLSFGGFASLWQSFLCCATSPFPPPPSPLFPPPPTLSVHPSSPLPPPTPLPSPPPKAAPCTYLTVTLWGSRWIHLAGDVRYTWAVPGLEYARWQLFSPTQQSDPQHPDHSSFMLIGTPITCSELVLSVWMTLQETSMDTSHFFGRSFRIRAAAAQAGLPDFLLEMLGRWKSATFLRCIRTPNSTVLIFSQTLL